MAYTFTEDFSQGDLSNYTLRTGSLGSFSIVSDDYGNALQVAPGPTGLDTIEREITTAPVQEVAVKFKVTAAGTDDYGRLIFRDADDAIVFNFNAGRQSTIDALRRPTVAFDLQPSQTENPIGAGAVTLNRWYEMRATYNADTGIFACSVTDLTDDSVFGSIEVEVTARTDITKINFMTEDQQSSGSTVLWDDLVITLAGLRAGNAVFFRLDTAPPLRLWCGINDVPIELTNVDAAGAVYLGAGRLLNVPDLEVLINGLADRVEFYLPGVSVENSNRVASGAPDIQGKPVHVGIATLDDRYQPLTAITPVWYGLADLWAMKQPQSSDPSQSPSRTLVLSVGSGRTGRARARRASYTPAQQKLVYPTDLFCDFTPRYTTLYDVVWPKFTWPLWLLGGALVLSNWMGHGLG